MIISDITELHFNYNHPSRITTMKEEDGEVTITPISRYFLNVEGQDIIVSILDFRLVIEHPEAEDIIVFDSSYGLVFKEKGVVDNFKKDKATLIIPRNIVLKIVQSTRDTVRGWVASRLMGTELEKAYLPILDISEFVENNDNFSSDKDGYIIKLD